MKWTVPAAFDPLEILAHSRGLPARVAGEIADVIPIWGHGVPQDHGVVRRAASQGAATEVEDAALRRLVVRVPPLLLFVFVVPDEENSTSRRNFRMRRHERRVPLSPPEGGWSRSRRDRRRSAPADRPLLPAQQRGNQLRPGAQPRCPRPHPNPQLSIPMWGRRFRLPTRFVGGPLVKCHPPPA
jgi:hypothetical protein